MRPPRSRQLPIFRDQRRKDTFRQKPLCSSNVLSATQRTGTSGKNYWAILRGTGIPESIRAIGVSYSLLGAFAEHDQRVVARVGALLLDEQPSDSSDQQLCLLYLRYRTAATFLSLPQMQHETGKPLHIKGLLRILIPPCGGSNPPAPATQSGLCIVSSGCGRTADIPLVLKLLEEVAARRPFEISHRAGWRVLCCCNQSGHCLRPIDQPSRQVTCPQPEAPAVAG